MSSQPKPASVGGLFLLAGAVMLALAILGVRWLRRPTEVLSAPKTVAPRRIEGQAVKPAPPSEGYVGSATCARCHAAIAEEYERHPMHRSAGRTPGPDDTEDFGPGTEFQSDDGRIYRVVKEDDAIWHHELLLDEDGQVIYDDAAKIGLFIGSGARGKSYAIDRDGSLFQSPISWYTRDHKWDLSPGYNYRHLRFRRRINEGCLECHAGRATHDPERDDYFPGSVLLEAAIGCERCHGPGEQHVALHESGSTRLAETIVNPAKLEPQRREAVCYQCHLIGAARPLRYGRSLYGDFRPGDRIDEVWSVLVASTTVRGRKTKAVSHVEQMRESTCFIKSQGRMGCTSCHDPHSVPLGNAADHFRRRCLECHAEKGCSLPAEQQAAAPANNSCVHCHMPRLGAHDIAHASQTDHRILRLPEVPDDDSPGLAPRELVLFDEGHSSLPQWEAERAKVLTKVLKLRESGHASQTVVHELEQTLGMLAEIAPDDPPTWAALAAVAELRDDNATARTHWERVLALRPSDELALDALIDLCLRTGDGRAGLAFADRLIEINPNRARDFSRRAALRGNRGQWRGAIADAERALQIEPLDKGTRRWLVDAYRRLGDVEASRRQADVLKRITALRLAPG